MKDIFACVPIEGLADHRLTLIETRILGVLFSYWDKKTKAPIWPSREALAGRSGYQLRAVSKGIAGLVEKGWVTRRQHRGPNTYEIHVPDLAKIESANAEKAKVADKKLCTDRTQETLHEPCNLAQIEQCTDRTQETLHEPCNLAQIEQCTDRTLNPARSGHLGPPDTLLHEQSKNSPKEGEVRAREMLPNCDDPPKAAQKPPAQSRGTRLTLTDLPPDWAAWCREKFSHLDAGDVWEVFHDYWIAQPGQKGVKLDWLATWRNWCRRDADKRKATMSKQERIEAANKKLLSDRNARSHNGHNGHNTIDGEFHVINH